MQLWATLKSENRRNWNETYWSITFAGSVWRETKKVVLETKIVFSTYQSSRVVSGSMNKTDKSGFVDFDRVHYWNRDDTDSSATVKATEDPGTR